MSHNQFSEDIPLKITELKSLQALFLSHNSLTGEIPESVGNLTYLQVIDLSYNSLSGPIPSNIVGCFQLLALILSNNLLSGEIQPELDALNSLNILDISNNEISGQIPQTLAGCSSLEVVAFSSNSLTGPLNDAMNKWLNLKFLSLAQNKFEGPLPSWIFTFPSIRTIDLSENRFSGYILDGTFNVSKNFNNATIIGANLDENLLSVKNKIQISVMDSSRKKQGYWRFPEAFTGNLALCLEVSAGKCQPPKIPALLGYDKDGLEEGPISEWSFCATSAITFYVTLIALFCWPRSRNYILRSKV